MLAFGMLLLFVGVLFLVGFAGAGQKLILSTISILLCLAGLSFLYIYVAFSRTAFKLFAGLSLLLNGFFILCENKCLFPLGFGSLWPVMILLISVALFAASRTKSKKFNINYDFTAISLFVLGIFFSPVFPRHYKAFFKPGDDASASDNFYSFRNFPSGAFCSEKSAA